MDLFGRVALVTGGSGDLGTAACIALARAGCDVALTYVGNREGAAQTATPSARRARLGGPLAAADVREGDIAAGARPSNGLAAAPAPCRSIRRNRWPSTPPSARP